MNRRNEFEYLRIPEIHVVLNANITESILLYNASHESVTLHISEVAPKQWAIGYQIYFENGRIAEKKPGDLAGWFKSAKDAELYFLGYMLQYSDCFTDSCIYEIKKRILKLIQPDLFSAK